MKTFFKLAGKCLLVLFPLIAMIVVLSQTLMWYINGDAMEMLWLKENVSTHQEKHYDVVVLGDSIANANYLPEVLSDNMINLAVSNMAPVSCYYAMETWLEHNEPPKVCYLSFADMHFAGLGGFWKATVFAHTFSFQQDLEAIKTNAACSGTDIWKSGDLQQLLSYRLWSPKMYITSFLNASFNQRNGSNKELWAARDLHYGRYFGVTTNEYKKNAEHIYETFSPKGVADEYYKRLIKLCQDNDIKVRLVYLPLPESSTVLDTYRETFDTYHNALTAEYPGVTADFFPQWPDALFSDMHHMNSYGALYFSTELKKLYPEDFGDEPLSEGQIAGINDYISQEVKLDHIFDWTAGRGYTVLLYDAQGMVPYLYGWNISTAVSDTPLAVTPLDPDWTLEGDSIYAVTDSGWTDVTAEQAEDGTLTVQLPGGESAPWEVKPGADLGVFVIDALGRTVCAKSFDYTEGPEFTVLS